MREPEHLAARAAYEPVPTAAAQARRFVRHTLCSWDLAARTADADSLLDDAVLLTSELVTNAVVHAGTPLDVTCRLTAHEVEVAVHDRHPARTLPHLPQKSTNSAERGRGLLLPSALASSWGVTYTQTAKSVWFRLNLVSIPADADPADADPADADPAHADPADSDADGAAGKDAANGAAVADATQLDALGDSDAPDRSAPHPIPHAPGIDEPDGQPSGRGTGRRPARAGTDGNGWAGGSGGAGGSAAVAAVAGLRRDVGMLGYDELLRHTVEAARDAVAADAAYALVADEDGELRVRAAAGVGMAGIPSSASAPALLAGGAAAHSLVTVPFLVDGRVTGVLGVAAAEPERFSAQDASRLQAVADRVAMSLERARLSDLERVRRGRIGFLAEASELLASTLDQEKTISLTAQLIVPRLATWCVILLADDTATLRPAYVWHADEARIDGLGSLLSSVPPPSAPEAGQSWSLAFPRSLDLPPDAAELATDAAWCFPLAARGRTLGVVVIGKPRGERLARETIELAEDLTRRAALALDNARLYEHQQTTSRALQRSLLPPELPRIPGVDLAVAHEAAGEGNEVGGDFYDVFAAGPNRWRFAIGDVCGTGPEAAAVTGLARHTLRILAREGRDVADVLGRLNHLILDEGPRARFITLLHGEITLLSHPAGPAQRRASATGEDAPERGKSASARDMPALDASDSARVRLSLVCAGHPLPLLLRAQDAGSPGVPAAESQPLLGVMNHLSFGAQDLDLFPGDILLCVTDGITERKNSGRLLDDNDGLARILAGCGGLTAGAVAARIQRAADDFGTDPASDDMALLVLRAL